jgi:hypothetical protein
MQWNQAWNPKVNIEAGHVVVAQSFKAVVQSYISHVGHAYSHVAVLYEIHAVV